MQVSRAICGIHATNVGIVRKASRRRKTHYGRSALSCQLAANRRRDQEQGNILMLHPPLRQRPSPLARRVRGHLQHARAWAMTQAAPAATQSMRKVWRVSALGGGFPVPRFHWWYAWPPPARFSHDSNICRMNATDGAGSMQYLLPHISLLQGDGDTLCRTRSSTKW